MAGPAGLKPMNGLETAQMVEENGTSKNSILISAFLFALLVSLYFQKFYFYVGFAFKPYMVVLALIIVYIVYFRQEQEMISRMYAYEYVFLIFGIYTMWRGYFSEENVLSLRITIVMLIGIALYVFVSSLAYSIDDETMLRIIYVASIIFLLASLILFFSGQGSTEEGGITDLGSYRLTGSIDDPNIFGIFASLIYGISFHKLVCGGKKYLISLLMVIACILLTWSRGALLAVVAFNILYIIKFKGARYKSLIVNLIIFAVFSAGVLFWMNNTSADIRNNIEMRMQDVSGSERIDIWLDALEVFEDFPVSGIGLNNFREYNLNLFSDERLVHNAYLEVIVEEGMTGFLIFMAALLLMIFKRDYSDFEKIVKIVLCMQFLMLVFLSNLFNEFIFFTMALYKTASVRREECEMLGDVYE